LINANRISQRLQVVVVVVVVSGGGGGGGGAKGGEDCFCTLAAKFGRWIGGQSLRAGATFELRRIHFVAAPRQLAELAPPL